jgi:hypothetical protein
MLGGFRLGRSSIFCLFCSYGLASWNLRDLSWISANGIREAFDQVKYMRVAYYFIYIYIYDDIPELINFKAQSHHTVSLPFWEVQEALCILIGSWPFKPIITHIKSPHTSIIFSDWLTKQS